MMISVRAVDKIVRYGIGGVLFVQKEIDCLGCNQFVKCCRKKESAALALLLYTRLTTTPQPEDPARAQRIS